MGVILTVIALLYILCKYVCAYFRNIDINTFSAHVYGYTLNSSHSGIKLPRYLYMSHSTKVEEFLSLKQILLFLLSFSSILSLVVCFH